MNTRKFVLKMVTGVSLLSSLNLALVSAEESVKLGGNFELSGSAASYGSPMNEGAKLAVKEANDQGGVLGGDVIYVEYDNKSDLTETASVATRLSNEGVSGVVGPATSGDVKAQMSVLDQAKIPSIAPAATLDGLTLKDNGDLYEYFFRVCFSDSYQGRAGAAYASDQLKAKKVAIVTDQATDYSLGLADAFKDEFTSRGGEVVAEDAIQSGDTDFSAVLTQLLGQDFDVLFVPVYYTEAGLFIKQAREMGITQPIVGSDGFHSDTLVELAGPENANDIYYTSHFSTKSDDDTVKAFVKAYQDEYGKEADTFSALAYDATNLLLDAIERADSSQPEDIQKALAETKDFQGVTGKFSVDDQHNPVKTATMIKLTNGEVESAEQVSAE